MSNSAFDTDRSQSGQSAPRPARIQYNLRTGTAYSANNLPYIDISIACRNPDRFGLSLHTRMGVNGCAAEARLAPALRECIDF